MIKKGLITLFLLAFGLLGIITALKLSDTGRWICISGNWVAFGNPKASSPNTGCGDMHSENQVVGADEDEKGCILSAGYSWCEEKQKCLRPWEEECEGDQITDYLLDLKTYFLENLEISFSSIGNNNFAWKTKFPKDSGGSQLIQVKSKFIQTINVPAYLKKLVTDYFEGLGFATSPENSFFETNSGSQGFIKDRYVCILSWERAANYTQESSVNYNITVSCGSIN